MRFILIKIFFLCAFFSRIELMAQSIDPSFIKEESEVQILLLFSRNKGISLESILNTLENILVIFLQGR